MRTFILLLFFALILFFHACKDVFSKYDNRMKIKNNSSIDVFFIESYQYPDTSINTSNPGGDKLNHLVTAGTEKVNRSSSSWEYIFSSDLPSDTLVMFIFDSHTLENTPWDTVRKNYLILKRYDLSYDDLVKMDWTITYP